VARRPAALLALALAALACAGGAGGGALDAGGEHYLRFVSYEVPVNERVLLRWEARQMPLRVHLPPPPAGLASDPAAVWDAVRDGVTDWTDVASPGVPSFRFVDDPGDADIPIVWEAAPSGDWFIAHCVYDVNWAQRRFGVARILVTARYQGREAGLDELYVTVLHEMGHALGLAGHSPAAGDAMHPRAQGARELSARDRETLRLLYAKPIGTRVAGARKAD
jgi:predicted Zn-dependent protease